MKQTKLNWWSFTLLGTIVVAAFLVSIFFAGNSEVTLFVDQIVIVLLSLLSAFLYIIGGGIILFGSILLTIRYVRAKLSRPFRPFGSVPRVTFLTLGLEIFIGAELINTAVQRTMDDFLLLMLTILTRGLIGLILYLEKRWGHEEYEACIAELEAKGWEKAEEDDRKRDSTVDI